MSREDDEARLVQWKAFAPTAGGWLEASFGLSVASAPEDLKWLWARAMPLVSPAVGGPTPPDDVPEWARSEEWWPYRLTFDAPTVTMLGTLAAYFGELLIARAPGSPSCRWQVFRHRRGDVVGEGDFVVSDGRLQRNGLPFRFTNPQRTLAVLGSVQITEPMQPEYPLVGKNDPGRLYQLFGMRLRDLGG